MTRNSPSGWPGRTPDSFYFEQLPAELRRAMWDGPYVAATRAKSELIELDGEPDKNKAVRRGRAADVAGPTVADQHATSARPRLTDEERRAAKRERARKRRDAKKGN